MKNKFLFQTLSIFILINSYGSSTYGMHKKISQKFSNITTGAAALIAANIAATKSMLGYSSTISTSQGVTASVNTTTVSNAALKTNIASSQVVADITVTDPISTVSQAAEYIPTITNNFPHVDTAFVGLNKMTSTDAISAVVASGVDIALPLGLTTGYAIWVANKIHQEKKEGRLLTHTPETIYELCLLHDEMLRLTTSDGNNNGENNNKKAKSWWKLNGYRYTILLGGMLYMSKHAYNKMRNNTDDSKKLEAGCYRLPTYEKLIDLFMTADAATFGANIQDYKFREIAEERTETETGTYSKVIERKDDYDKRLKQKDTIVDPTNLKRISAQFDSHQRTEKPAKPVSIAFEHAQHPTDIAESKGVNLFEDILSELRKTEQTEDKRVKKEFAQRKKTTGSVGGYILPEDYGYPVTIATEKYGNYTCQFWKDCIYCTPEKPCCHAQQSQFIKSTDYDFFNKRK